MELTAQKIADSETRYFKADFIEKNGDKFVPWRRLDKALARFRKGMVEGIAEALEKSLGPVFGALGDRIKALEKELAVLKENGPNLADAYKGAWLIGSYRRGSVVTMNGGMWLALKDTDDKPGTSDAFKLVVKAGKDAKA